MNNNDLNKNGPDQIISSDSFYSSKLNKPVKLRSNETDLKLFPVQSIYTVFKQTVLKQPSHPALAYKSDDKKWHFISYNEYWQLCIKAAKSFIKLKLEPNTGVVTILGFNSHQWFISCLGSIFASGISCGIYTTNSTETCEFIFDDTKSEIVVVENKQQLDKILKCKNINNIKKIIQYTGTVENSMNGLIMSWNEFIDYGTDVSEDQVNDRIKMMAPNKCATIIYTSGTTGNPKGALLSHDNIVYAVRNMGIGTAKFRFFKEKIVSYLPLSHIAALANDLFGSLGVGATTYFAQPDALKGSLLQTLKEVQPTLFFGVPRIWEKFQDQLESVINTTLTGNKLRLFKWAQTCSYNHFLAKFNNKRSFDFSFYLAKLLVFKKIHKKLGLDKCRLFISGAAPIKKETLEFFIKIAIPLTETYGMSESTGPHSIGTIQANRITSVGKLNEYNKTLVVRKQETDDLESGELCMNGRHIFMGYLNEELKTKETFDADNWLHTGDLAKIDSDGFIFITGRLKELIITAGGENIAPVPIEDRIKLELNKLVSNCILIGDKQRYLVVLICLKSNVNTDTGEPLDDLTNDCIAFLQSIGSKSTKVSDIVNHKDKIVYKEIENGIKRANNLSISRAATVQKFEILERDFSLINGELGPTLKLRRPIVVKMYASQIDKLYSENSPNE